MSYEKDPLAPDWWERMRNSLTTLFLIAAFLGVVWLGLQYVEGVADILNKAR